MQNNNNTELKLLLAELECFAEEIPEKSTNKQVSKWRKELNRLIRKYKPNEEYKVVYLYFTTCTTREAIDEINIMLKRTPYALIDEINFVESSKADIEEDWFEDYNFTFQTCISDSEENIKEKLHEAGLSFEIMT